MAVRAITTTAAGALRLAHRALETHARDVGYEIDAWVDRALEHAGALLSSQVDAEAPVLLDHARLAAIALTRATAATADDRMLVPDELASGLGAPAGRLPGRDGDRMSARLLGLLGPSAVAGPARG